MQRSGPLAAMRVVDLTHVMAGPVATRMLADMGADVIKIEKPAGDDSRRMLPPDIGGEGAAFMMVNRNKRGIALDLKTEQGRDVVRRLVATADVLIENNRHDTLDNLGLGATSLQALNPGLIVCAISGFGRTGPLAEEGGYDLIAQGMSGLMSITGEGPGRPPVKVGSPVCDITAGLIAAMAISAAFAHKVATGQGQFIDTSLLEAGITLTYWQSAMALATGVSPGPMGSAHPLSAPYQAFETADGWINVGGANQRLWERLTGVIGAPHLRDDARFRTGADRMAHLQDLVDALTPVFKSRPTAAWLAALKAAEIPAGPVLSVGAMHAHPQTRARDMVVGVDHPLAGRVETIGFPAKFSRTPAAIVRPSPRLGEHTREVLAEAGYSDTEVAALIASGAALGLQT
jgi:crotonobetainyl-CoA:carnitine CoA-transferase CaiB-like acyl-CoA transferase